MRTRVLLLAALLTLVPGCGGEEKEQTSSAPRPKSTATVGVISPVAGDVVDAGKLTVKLDLKGGRILKKASRNLTPDTGHLHLFVDGDVVSQTFKLSQSITVKPGRHLLMVEFVAADHGSFDPRVLESITFEAK